MVAFRSAKVRHTHRTCAERKATMAILARRASECFEFDVESLFTRLRFVLVWGTHFRGAKGDNGDTSTTRQRVFRSERCGLFTRLRFVLVWGTHFRGAKGDHGDTSTTR